MNIGPAQSARTRLALATALALTLAACGGGGDSSRPTPSNPVPSLSSISPSTVTAGGAGFSLTVNGSNFISASVVRWVGEDRVTTFVSSTELTAGITPDDIADGGTAQVTVFNPTPGGGTSNGLSFTIENPVPTLNSLSPATALATGPDFTLQARGTDFVPSSVVRWNGSDRATTFVNSRELTATILASDIATTGAAQVSVFNPTPGGGTSGDLTFSVTAPGTLVLETTRLPDSVPGKAYHFVLSLSGGVPPFNWALASGSSLPAGLTLGVSSGLISGTIDPTAAGQTTNFTVQVMDSASPPNSASQPLSIQVLAGPLGRNDFCTSGSEAGTTRISNGTLRASFSPHGDVDVYSFQGTAGKQVSIETFAQRLDLDGNPATRDSQADTILELLDGNCSQITFHDDIVMGEMQDSRIQNFTLPSSPGGLYLIRVRDFRGDGRPDLIYDLSVSATD